MCHLSFGPFAVWNILEISILKKMALWLEGKSYDTAVADLSKYTFQKCCVGKALMAFSMFFLASPRCADGEPVSLGSAAEDMPLVVRDGRKAIISVAVRFCRNCEEESKECTGELERWRGGEVEGEETDYGRGRGRGLKRKRTTKQCQRN